MLRIERGGASARPLFLAQPLLPDPALLAVEQAGRKKQTFGLWAGAMAAELGHRGATAGPGLELLQQQAPRATAHYYDDASTAGPLQEPGWVPPLSPTAAADAAAAAAVVPPEDTGGGGDGDACSDGMAMEDDASEAVMSGGGGRGRGTKQRAPPPATKSSRREAIRHKCGTQGVAKLVTITTRLYIGVAQVREWLGEVEERRQVDVKVMLDNRLQPTPHNGELMYNKGAHYYWVTGTSLRRAARGRWFMGWRHTPGEGLVLLLRSPKDPEVRAAKAEGVPLAKETAAQQQTWHASSASSAGAEASGSGWCQREAEEGSPPSSPHPAAAGTEWSRVVTKAVPLLPLLPADGVLRSTALLLAGQQARLHMSAEGGTNGAGVSAPLAGGVSLAAPWVEVRPMAGQWARAAAALQTAEATGRPLPLAGRGAASGGGSNAGGGHGGGGRLSTSLGGRAAAGGELSGLQLSDLARLITRRGCEAGSRLPSSVAVAAGPLADFGRGRGGPGDDRWCVDGPAAAPSRLLPVAGPGPLTVDALPPSPARFSGAVLDLSSVALRQPSKPSGYGGGSGYSSRHRQGRQEAQELAPPQQEGRGLDAAAGTAAAPPIPVPPHIADLLPAERLPAWVWVRFRLGTGPVSEEALRCRVRAVGEGGTSVLCDLPAVLLSIWELDEWRSLQDGSLLLSLRSP
ncbi:hypothetical protein HYH03_014569 [Edaphochlamys debaryana]|uniref:Uncharacterized protein n=1 Tax=Edaphochlamys debaryana TaxID=47281 RepID=A0A835XTS8_9CHLO|nr:hypothetical protein HYH03_014569 [Edaphochlamys debaryana]|eukprot:KAG2486770.1 hypothetical protein HYH03_014569 [Edaphochlamys debaryana]